MAEEHAATTHTPSVAVEGEKDFQRQRIVEQATAEGHDADIPSDIGYLPDELGEANRRHSIADQRQDSPARKSERASHDIEKGTGVHEKKKKTGVETSGTLDDEANIVWW